MITKYGWWFTKLDKLTTQIEKGDLVDVFKWLLENGKFTKSLWETELRIEKVS